MDHLLYFAIYSYYIAFKVTAECIFI